MTFPRSAWLVCVLDISKSPPVVTGTGIFSEPSPTLNRRYRCFEVMSEGGVDYVTAKMKIINIVKDPRHCDHWAYKILEKR